MTDFEFSSIHEMVLKTVEKHSGKIAFNWFLDNGHIVSITWSEFYDQLKKTAKSLIALGVDHGDKINILSNTCFRWVLCDLAAVSIGAVTVGIYQSNLPKDCRYIIDHSDAVLVFAEDEDQLKKMKEIREEIPDVKKVVLFRGVEKSDDWVMSFEEFLELGKDIGDDAFMARVEKVSPQDMASIVYTSGTTGVPKGAVLTQDNVLFTAGSVLKSGDLQEGDTNFLFLPLAHVFARTCLYSAVMAANATTFFRGMDTLIEDFKKARPDWFISVPRIFEKVYSRVVSQAEAKGGAALKIFRWARDVGEKVSDLKLEKKSVPFSLKIQYAVADRLVFSKLKAALGGRVRWCISGAAPLNPTIAKFFHSAGVLILEGIGMTENTSFTNVNRIDNYRFGWVGPPGPGIEQKIAEDGEILFRGRNVMKEYYKMPDQTRATITPDGWLLTGDVGEIDAENFLRVTGRKKELIITAGGKNVAPSAIEGEIATSKYINQIMVIGDQRKFLTALVTLDMENVEEYAKEKNIAYHDQDELMNLKEIQELIESEVAQKNKEFASFETVKKVRIVPEFTVENGLLTPTMKVKKKMALQRYQEEIDAMYPKE